MPDDPLVRCETIDGGVGVVTLNAPHRLNAIDHGPGSLAEALLDALERADEDPDVRCIVVTGAGRAFSAGGDPGPDGPRSPLEWYRFLESNAAETERMRGLRTPTVAAVNGLCYGFGLIITLHLDLVVAVDSARFGLIETRFGSTGAQMLPFVVGPQWAKFLTLSGELIDAATAKEIGLVLAVFDTERFWAKSLDLARRVAAMPHDAAVLNRRVVNGAMTMMGWDAQREFSLALNTLTNQLAGEARTADGRRLADIRRDAGWTAYKRARDAPFEPPWLTS